MAYDERTGVTASHPPGCSQAPAASLLIIDDDVRPDDALPQLLSLDNFHVACASTGADGIARAFASDWDVVVLDLHLPDILGITVLSELRRGGFAAPVFVTTGWFLSTGHREAASALGAAGFLPKPLMADDLGGTLRREIFRRTVARSEQRPIEGERLAETVPAPSRTRTRAASEDDVVRSLYDRVLAGDPRASDTLCERLLPVLERSIARDRDRREAEWAHDAAVDALMEFHAHLHRFDVNRGVPLTAFLRMVARRNLLNRGDGECRRRAHEVPGERLLSHARMPAPDYERRLDLKRIVMSVWARLSHVEKQVLTRVLQGERGAGVLAPAAGEPYSTPADEQRIAKTITNRLFSGCDG